jgi:predicted nucleotide-binding protein
MTVKLLAIAACIGAPAAPLLNTFWTVTALARSIFLSTPDHETPRLSSRPLMQSAPEGLGLTELQARQVLVLLESEYLLSLTTSNNAGVEWQAVIANRIYDYRDVTSLAQYLRLREKQEVQLEDSSDHARDIHAAHMNPPDGAEPDPRKVFVISGRDSEATQAVCDFLRDLDLHPLLWEELVAATGSGSPYTGEVVTRAFNEGRAVVAILTPDDEARLHPTLHSEHEEDYEREYTGQPRPNVLFEAGMALIAQPDRTILVEIGRLRPVSDLTGRNTVRLGASAAPLLALKQRLSSAGCAVQDSNPAWMNTDRFARLSARTRQPLSPAADAGDLPRGRRLTSTPRPAEPNLTARLLDRGEHSYLLEISNRGGVSMRNITWELPEGVSNWDFMNSVLPSYPYDELAPRDYLRVPALVTFGGPVVVDLTISGDTPDDHRYTTRARLSVYG